MRARLPALLAFAASLIPFTAFWLAAPDHPRSVLLAFFAAGLCVWLACAAADFVTLPARLVSRLIAGCAVAWLVLCLCVAGPMSAFAFALQGAAATAVGAGLLSRLDGFTPIERLVLSYLTGLAIFIAVLSLLLPLGVHYPAAYALVALAIVWWRRASLRDLLGQCGAQLRGLRQTHFGGAPALVLVAVLVWAWGALGTLTPVVAADDLAYHLRLPYELLVRHRYTFDVVHQIWASAPWASDLAFAIPFLIAGGDEGAKTWVAGSYHLASAVQLFGLLARALPLRAALSFLIAFLSIPLAMAVNHTLHTEGLSALLVLAVFSLWVRQRGTQSISVLVAAALLLALLGAIKSSNLVASLFLGLLWLPALLAAVRARPRAAAALVAAFATVLIPYITSWVRTGNPVLPLFNAFFGSPYAPAVNFSNSDYAGQFDRDLYGDMFLHATRFLETQTDVAAGLAVFLLLPAACLLLAWRGDRERRAAAGVALAYALVLLSSQQYLRYIFPVLGLGIYAVSRIWDERGLRAWWTALLVLSASVGVAAMPQAFWQTSFQDVAQSLTEGGREAYLTRFAPQRALNKAANDDLGVHATVAYVGDMFGADLYGTPLYPNWLSPGIMAAAKQVRDEPSAAHFFRTQRVTHFVPPDPARPMNPGLRRGANAAEAYARAHGRVAAVSGNLVLIALDDDHVWPTILWSQQGGAIDVQHAVWGSTPVEKAQPLLLQVEGTCDGPQAVLWVRVRWMRSQLPEGEMTKHEPCLRNTFRMRVPLQAPRRADAVEIGIGAQEGAGATLTHASIRGMGQP